VRLRDDLTLCAVWAGLLLATAANASCYSRNAADQVSAEQSAVTSTSPAITLNVSITTPKAVSISAITVGANGTLTIGAGTKINGRGSVPSVVANVGTLGSDAEPDAIVGDVWSNGTVTLKDRVHAFGKVYAPALNRGNSVLVDGGLDTATPRTPSATTTWSVTYPSAVVNGIVLQNNSVASPSPGRYGAVQVFAGSKLTLSAGTYYVDSLDLESGSSLILNQDAGPVLLYVRTQIIFLRGTLSTTSGSPADLLLTYLGTTDLIVEMPFVGTIVAPVANLSLRSVAVGHSGAFFGKNVDVGPNTTIQYRAPNVVNVTQPPGDPAQCSASVVIDSGLTGQARELQYQKDILRYCTGIGISSCEQSIRARMNVDFVTAAASIYTNRMTTGTYIALLRDRERKLSAFRANPSLACDVALHDGDGDFVPDSTDACKNTPPLTPVLANGCTNSSFPAGPNITDVQKIMANIGVSADPRCIGAPEPVVPAPLGAFRLPSDPTQGKAILISKDPGTTSCPLYYQFEAELTDGNPPHLLTIAAGEDVTVSWIPKPTGAIEFNLHTYDSGNRAVWASYSVYTETFRVRAFNLAGQGSRWSDPFSVGSADCVSGQPCHD